MYVCVCERERQRERETYIFYEYFSLLNSGTLIRLQTLKLVPGTLVSPVKLVILSRPYSTTNMAARAGTSLTLLLLWLL